MQGDSSGGGRPRGTLLRRLLHMATAIGVVYYLIPVELPFFGLRRWVLLVAFFALIGLIESLRLRRGTVFYGLRPHERAQLASYVWFAAGATVVLWCFPHDIASVAIIGMAFVDPLMGELRYLKLEATIVMGVSGAAYLAIALAVLFLSGHWSLLQTIILASAGTALAIPSEWYKVAYVDDDFLMMTVPAAAMAWLSLAL